MAFIEGTQVFTNSGFKPIEDISGHDKVLVRNFLGDAEFIQPFALKKRQYDGEMVQIGAKNWSFTVTPDHIVVYDRDDMPIGDNFTYQPAKDVELHKNNRIYRKFKYLAPEDYKPETIVAKDEFGKRWLSIPNRDWYVLVAYVLCRGYFEKSSSRKYALNIFLNKNNREEELSELQDILDRLNIPWSLIPSYTDDRWFIRIPAKSSLYSRIITRLGSRKRKEMFLADKLIYNSSKELATLLIDTIIKLSKKPETEVGDHYQFTTNNEKLVQSLVLLGTLWGYAMSPTILAKKGESPMGGTLTKDVYSLRISNVPQTYSPTNKNSLDYKGYVYEIDLFDGQVYVKEKGNPVWINPK